MATTPTTSKSLSELFKSMLKPSPGLTMDPRTATANSTRPTTFATPGAPAIAPVVPSPAMSPVPSRSSGPIFGGGGGSSPIGPTGGVGSSGATGSMGNTGATGPQKPSLEQIADGIANRISSSAKNGDVGNLAVKDLSGGTRTPEQLGTDARNINNTRNDIAVGETDPYGVASKSGIAYTPEELKAIESAYAGIYDPALNSVFTKLDSAQKTQDAATAAKAEQDKLKLQAELDAKKPYTLGKDDIRYDGQGNLIALGKSSGSGTDGGTYTPGANPTVDSFISGIKAGTYKPSDVPDQYKALVAQGMSVSQDNAPLSQNSTQAVSVINELLSSPGLGTIGGVGSIFDPRRYLPGTDSATSRNLANQLKGLLSLDNRKQLKGQGAISDFEFKVLGEASSALGIGDGGTTNLTDEEFKNQLNKLKLKLQVGPTSLTDDELQYLNDQGFDPDTIRSQYGSAGAPKNLTNVGNTTASTEGGKNRAQRNNNPLNIKASDTTLAYSGVSGMDEKSASDGGKFLQFSDPQAGFDAAKKLIQSPGYKNLSVDAALRRWSGNGYGADVAPQFARRFIGSLSDSELSQLIQSMAKREGFYA